MLILAKAILAFMIGYFFSCVIGFFLVPYLKKHHIGQTISIYVKDTQSQKNGTPTFGGLIFITSTILVTIILIIMGKIKFSENLLIVMAVFVSYAVLGFLDDFISFKSHHNDGLTALQKLTGQLIIALIFFYIFLKSGGQPILNIHTLGIKLNMGWFYGIFLLLVLIGSSNAVNLTDGLDGLAGGLSLISFLSLGIISWGSTWVTGYQDMAIFCFILAGSLLGFLFYNTYPAKVFMGDTGSLSLGATMATIAILTNHELTLLIVAGVFIIETLSSIIQIISVKYFHHKVFLMAPLHHHFEKLGWEETDIVKMFYFIGLMLNLAAVAFGVWI